MSDVLRAVEEIEAAIKALLCRDERSTCQHDETTRGGAIWEICSMCGAKWADDEGGKPEWQEPNEWGMAHKALSLLPTLRAALALAANRTRALQDAIEGECDGIAISEQSARNILSHIGAEPASAPVKALEEVEALAEALRKAAAEWSAKSGIKLPYWQSLAVAVMPALAPVTDDGSEALIQDLNLINCGVEASEAYKRVLARDARQRAEINRLKGNDNG